MGTNPSVNGASTSMTPATTGLYASPDDALKKVSSEYEYWTGKLTETSLQMCYALIGADWVVFGSVQGILSSMYAKWSLILVLLALASNVIGAWLLSRALRKQIAHGEGKPTLWAAEYVSSMGKAVPWPFTAFIENAGDYMRWIKAGFTLASGICLIIGAIVTPPPTH